ncbi:MAG: GNAT family N-acetyltransferase [Lachnospiraceae bacterium]|nr:GNAT family N-acetyltransferase [Lachnospiraceae bacterium]
MQKDTCLYAKAKDALYKQLALDYCVGYEDVADRENHFTVFTPLPGRRRFRTSDDCGLKVAAVNGKLLFTGTEEIMACCRERYATTSGDWFMDVERFRELEEIVRPHGFKLGSAHPFYLPAERPEETEEAAVAETATPSGISIVKYDRGSIEQFRDDKRFQNAYSFEETAPDMLGVGAVANGKILGMAGASADSETLWQIGIDVDREARGKHLGALLVRILKEDILRAGHMPFYGTSMSNIGSQRVAHHAGFIAAWAELGSSRI